MSGITAAELTAELEALVDRFRRTVELLEPGTLKTIDAADTKAIPGHHASYVRGILAGAEEAHRYALLRTNPKLLHDLEELEADIVDLEAGNYEDGTP